MCITFEIPTRLIISFLGPSRSTVLLHKKIGRARNLDTRNNNQSEFLCPEEEHISFVIDFISVWRMSCWRLWGLLRGISLNHRSNHRREEKKNLLLLLFFRWGGRIFDSSGFSNNLLGLNWEEQVKVVLPSFLKYLPLNISLFLSMKLVFFHTLIYSPIKGDSFSSRLYGHYNRKKNRSEVPFCFHPAETAAETDLLVSLVYIKTRVGRDSIEWETGFWQSFSHSQRAWPCLVIKQKVYYVYYCGGKMKKREKDPDLDWIPEPNKSWSVYARERKLAVWTELVKAASGHYRPTERDWWYAEDGQRRCRGREKGALKGKTKRFQLPESPFRRPK